MHAGDAKVGKLFTLMKVIENGAWYHKFGMCVLVMCVGDVLGVIISQVQRPRTPVITELTLCRPSP